MNGDIPLGTASFEGSVAPSMTTDGPCLTGTLENLKAGIASRALDSETLTRVRSDALELLSKVLSVYTAQVAAGEVGSGGTRLASSAPPSAGQCPTGLLYGRVQSGKTVAMIAFAAAAIDNGFRVVVVLTSDYLKLVEQTAKRFGDLSGPLIKDSFRIDDWPRDAQHVKRQIAEHGLVLVCAKNTSHLGSLVQFLETVDAGRYPALVLDDEADQATPDTTTAARSAQRPNAPLQGSTVFRRTIGNDAAWEEGESVRERLPHNVFLQVTATPYALLLQHSDHPLRPSFSHLLEPGAGYTGGEEFFDGTRVENGGRPYLVYVDEAESQLIQNGATEAPEGLRRAIAFFLVSCGAQALLAPALASQGQNFLCHTSARTLEHDRLGDLVRRFLAEVGEDIDLSDIPERTRLLLDWSLHELSTTLASCPPFEAIRTQMRRRIPRREIVIVNSTSGPADFGREMNFIIGGNILGRGLTIENLLVTYYLRKAKTSQMDTVLQHARMFGYRLHLMPFTRVFLPETLAFRFTGIHNAEQRLRQLLAQRAPRARVLMQTPPNLRPTRRNVLDTGSLSAYGPGEQVYPQAPATGRAAASQQEKFGEAFQGAFGGSLQPKQYLRVPIATLINLVELAPYSDANAGTWDPEMLVNALGTISGDCGDVGDLYYRSMVRSRLLLATGATSGEEDREAKARGVPVFMAFRDSGKLTGEPFWFPTLVFPDSIDTMVFNVS